MASSPHIAHVQARDKLVWLVMRRYAKTGDIEVLTKGIKTLEAHARIGGPKPLSQVHPAPHLWLSGAHSLRRCHYYLTGVYPRDGVNS